MMEVAGWTLTDILQALQGIPVEQEKRAGCFRYAKADRHGKPIQVTSDGWLVGQQQLNIKFVRIQSANLDIATVIITPTASPDLLPIFVTDLVVTSQHCHALIVDVEIAGDYPQLCNELGKVFDPLGRRWRQEFPPNPDVPAWFHEIAEEWALFSSCSLADLPLLRQAFREYLDAIVKHFYVPRLPQAAGGGDHPAVASYKTHHFEHSPGRKVMAPKFGAAYTEQLLRDYHFGPPRPHENSRSSVKGEQVSR
ncbi:MAG: hypothetical protein MI924_24270 [Chloroflexales bacterium]|nr:hypothetical protein [Chloroflexales bacterium]